MYWELTCERCCRIFMTKERKNWSSYRCSLDLQIPVPDFSVKMLISEEQFVILKQVDTYKKDFRRV